MMTTIGAGKSVTTNEYSINDKIVIQSWKNILLCFEAVVQNCNREEAEQTLLEIEKSSAEYCIALLHGIAMDSYRHINISSNNKPNVANHYRQFAGLRLALNSLLADSELRIRNFLCF